MPGRWWLFLENDGKGAPSCGRKITSKPNIPTIGRTRSHFNSLWKVRENLSEKYNPFLSTISTITVLVVRTGTSFCRYQADPS